MDRTLEDLVAIPDLVAGALQDSVARYTVNHHFPTGEWTLPPPDALAPKARRIMDWFADQEQPLKRLVYVVDTAPEQPSQLRFSRLSFLGARLSR